MPADTFYKRTSKEISAAEVVECARSYMGTPYRDWGRQKGKGVDCIGLPILIAHELGLFTGDFFAYQPTPRARRAEDVADANMERVLWEKGSERAYTYPGAVALFWYSNRREPTHFAVLAEHPADCTIPTMIHAHSSVGRVTEQSINDFWARRLVKVYALPGVIHG